MCSTTPWIATKYIASVRWQTILSQLPSNDNHEWPCSQVSSMLNWSNVYEIQHCSDSLDGVITRVGLPSNYRHVAYVNTHFCLWGKLNMSIITCILTIYKKLRQAVHNTLTIGTYQEHMSSSCAPNHARKLTRTCTMTWFIAVCVSNVWSSVGQTNQL